MESQIYSNLRSLISVVDKLRDIGLQHYIHLPRICVVGTQSSGKSSVLESIVGADFLPRGEGVVTRRPLELRLIHTPASGQDGSQEKAWAVFDNDRQKRYTDFEEVRREIDRLTDEVAGKNKGIVDIPIVLNIYGPNCPDLSVIDLPGITRVPLRGSDQTDDIEALTRDMAGRYAEDPRTIILAVIPANADISTADALQLARRVDPKGIRTIGVITKIDLMDRGTDAVRMLTGEEVPLRLGYTGVKNRSQADIATGKSIAHALEDEKLFFETNPIYKSLSSSVCGTPNLIEKLTKVLYRHIKYVLPVIRNEINNKKRSVMGRLKEIGTGFSEDSNSQSHVLWTMINDFCEVLRCFIRGKYDRRLHQYLGQEVKGMACIRQIFNNLLSEFIEKSCTLDTSDSEIDEAMQVHEGDSLPGFPSPDTFEYLMRPHLKKIYAPVMDCLDQVTSSLESLTQKLASRVFYRFPLLIEKVLEICDGIILREKDKTKGILDSIVASESGYLFTNDPLYLEAHGSIIKANSNKEGEKEGAEGVDSANPYDKKLNSKTNTLFTSEGLAASAFNVSNLLKFQSGGRKLRYSPNFINEIRVRVDCYFSIVLRNVRDSVPKCIGFFLIRQILDTLQFELYTKLCETSSLNDLLGEPQYILDERKSLNDQLRVLTHAHQVLLRDPSISLVDSSSASFDEVFDHEIAYGDANSSASHGGGYQASSNGNTPPHNPPYRKLFNERSSEGDSPGRGRESSIDGFNPSHTGAGGGGFLSGGGGSAGAVASKQSQQSQATPSKPNAVNYGMTGSFLSRNAHATTPPTASNAHPKDSALSANTNPSMMASGMPSGGSPPVSKGLGGLGADVLRRLGSSSAGAHLFAEKQPAGQQHGGMKQWADKEKRPALSNPLGLD